MMSGCERKSDKVITEFIEYAAKVFGVQIDFEKSDKPDTYKSLFGDLVEDNTRNTKE